MQPKKVMLLIALSKAQKAQTATYRVSVPGNNSNDGRTEETPKYIWTPMDVWINPPKDAQKQGMH